MDTKPLSYECLKSILRYMDAVKRFQLSFKYPSIKPAEKAVPLHIDYLIVTTNAININGVVLSLGVCRSTTHDDSEGMISFLENGAAQGGFPQDFHPISSDFPYNQEVPMTPGDIRIAVYDEEKHKKKEERKIYLRDLMLVREKRYLETLSNSTPHPHLYYLQINYISPKGTLNRRSPYIRRVPVVMKNIMTILLGGRQTSVHVDEFYITETGCVLRFPEDLKLKIKKIHVPPNATSVLNSIRPLLDETSFPLKEVNITGDVISEEPIVCSHPLIQNAGAIWIIDNLKKFKCIRTILELRHKQVVVDNGNIEKGDFITLVDHWLKNEREHGTGFSFYLVDKALVVAEIPRIFLVFPRPGSVPRRKRNVELKD